MAKINAREITIFIFSVNIISFAISMSTGQLLGDLSGQPFVTTYLFLALMFFVFSLVFLKLCHLFSSRIKPILIINASNHVGFIIALLNIGFVFYVYQTGLFLAGSSERNGGWGSTFFVIMNVDALMMIYLMSRVDDKYRTVNMFLWTVSYLQRGWISNLLFVFISWYLRRKFLGKKINFALFLLIFPLIFCIPYLDALKNNIRNGDSIAGFFSSSYDQPYILAMSEPFEKIINRFQTLSHITYILENSDKIIDFKIHVPLQNFYEENLVGLILAKVFLVENGNVSSDFLAKYIDPNLDSSWNVNPSLVGWIYLHDYYYFAPLIWIFLLISIFSFLQKTLVGANNDYVSAMVWFILVLFVLPGWIFQFTTLIISMLIYILLNIICNYTKIILNMVVHSNENTC